ncbi:MAG: thioredoxin family protein [Salinibacter sp.]
MAVESIERDRFEKVLQQAEGPVAVDLWMEDCPPCNMMAPKLKVVSEEYAGEVGTYRVQIDEDDPLLETYEVEAMPAILFFRDGALTGRVEGLVRADDLREAFGDYAPSP